MAAKGAAVLFIPTNNCLLAHKADVVARARNVQCARATENGVAVVAADVAGRQGDYISYGSSNIIDRDGTVVASPQPLAEDLLVADIQPQADRRMRGWDAARNPAVARAFVQTCYPEVG
jgi:predicted amidohydrolase